MDKRNRQFGFSLLEVLFAVLVLTMGLVFVASQFPLGMMNTRIVAETTLNAIDAHNAQIMIDLQLGSIEDGGSGTYIIEDLKVNLLLNPNERVDDGHIVMDDPGEGHFATPDDDPTYTQYDGGTISAEELPPFLSVVDDTGGDHHLSKQSVGMVVSPMVDRSDSQVRNQLIDLGYDLTLRDEDQQPDPDAFLDDLDQAIYDVAMGRKFTWCALYRSLPDESYCYYVFTLRRPNTNARYAIQNEADFTVGAAIAGDVEQDRLFPVPWRIELDREIDPTYLSDFPDGEPWDRFVLNEFTANDDDADDILDILREGSIIVDARYGDVYKILEINMLPNDEWQIRLAGDLNDTEYLRDFWVIPPAIDYETREFADRQPVLNVTQKIVRH